MCVLLGPTAASRATRAALAAEIDACIAAGLVGWMGDRAAHMSCNLTRAELERQPAIKAFLQILFDPEEGLGSILTTCVDGNGYVVRCHAQDGNKGDSSHPAHHDGFLSPGRRFTGVLSTVNKVHANWQVSGK